MNYIEKTKEITQLEDVFGDDEVPGRERLPCIVAYYRTWEQNEEPPWALVFGGYQQCLSGGYGGDDVAIANRIFCL
jgi:hypothetical protein